MGPQSVTAIGLYFFMLLSSLKIVIILSNTTGPLWKVIDCMTRVWNCLFSRRMCWNNLTRWKGIFFSNVLEVQFFIQLIDTLTLVSDWFLLPSLSPIPAGRRVGIILGWEHEDAPSPIRNTEHRNPVSFAPTAGEIQSCCCVILSRFHPPLWLQVLPIVTSGRR